MELSVELVRQRWREKAGFRLNRPDGANCYILLHFLTPVELTYGGKTIAAPCGSLIVFSPGYPHSFTNKDVLIHDWMHLSGDVDLLIAKSAKAIGYAVDLALHGDMAISDIEQLLP